MVEVSLEDVQVGAADADAPDAQERLVGPRPRHVRRARREAARALVERRAHYFSTVRIAAEPPLTLMRVPVSVRLAPLNSNTCTSFSTMLPTRIVEPSAENAAPCDHVPMGASATRCSEVPITRNRMSLPFLL